jgi:hypothetical protein
MNLPAAAAVLGAGVTVVRGEVVIVCGDRVMFLPWMPGDVDHATVGPRRTGRRAATVGQWAVPDGSVVLGSGPRREWCPVVHLGGGVVADDGRAGHVGCPCGPVPFVGWL